MTSGAIQNTVPCIAVDAPKPSILSVRLAIPKSDILQIPVVSTKILSALRSYEQCNTSVLETLLEGRRDAYSMKNTLRVEILQTREDLFCERLRDFFIKFAVLLQTTAYGATWNVFQEAVN